MVKVENTGVQVYSTVKSETLHRINLLLIRNYCLLCVNDSRVTILTVVNSHLLYSFLSVKSLSGFTSATNLILTFVFRMKWLRNDGGPVFYGYSNRTPVTGDVQMLTSCLIFGTIFLAFLIIFPGVRKEVSIRFACT